MKTYYRVRSYSKKDYKPIKSYYKELNDELQYILDHKKALCITSKGNERMCKVKVFKCTQIL